MPTYRFAIFDIKGRILNESKTEYNEALDQSVGLSIDQTSYILDSLLVTIRNLYEFSGLGV